MFNAATTPARLGTASADVAVRTSGGAGVIEARRHRDEHDDYQPVTAGLPHGVAVRSAAAPGVESQLRGWPDRAEPGHCQLGAGGRVCLTSFAGADLVADVSGFFPKGSAFTPIPNPRRILDTRPTAGPPASAVPGF